MVRYSCAACGSVVDLPMPALPTQPPGCPHCLRAMSGPGPVPADAVTRGGAGQPGGWTIKNQFRILGAIVAVFWALEIVDLFLPQRYSLHNWGIRPRDAGSLVCIFFAPFLHASLGHAAANTIPFLVF